MSQLLASKKEFASLISSKYYSRSTILWLNKTSNFASTRFDWITRDVMKWAGWSLEDGGIENAYWMAAYGLQWVVNTGRINGIATLAIRALNTRQMCELIHELAAHDENIGTYAAYLMAKFI